MEHIRKATREDIPRIAEILVFTKRVNYQPIFQNDAYSFGELTVFAVAQEWMDDPVRLSQTWVY
ncbi:MAG: GNAT family N-acetyltransferase, partial [Lachnospiraceae bacterium]|nr:GNAT family N-acetyltransferase [Lachnospiraceae bacterium]